ncbi:MAG: hypothetical protein PWP58_1649 [Bacillota bacterium]|jgi:ligand-binding sensor protein/quercetin dioxygenase-like cupin family protein/anti-sigma regulatory factor (Ser/Thr protein kinase)|nr:hypothetical protein [Bacillota bacterium]
MTGTLLKPRERQEFPWGCIEWWHTADGEGPGRVSLGAVTLWPYSRQAIHNHYADEQILYGISGTSVHFVNGRKFQLERGSWLYLPPYATHSMANTTPEEVRFILVANPVSAPYVEYPEPKIASAPEVTSEASLQVVQELTDQANLQEVQNKFASATGLTVSLVGPGGVLLTQPVNPPEFCRWCMARRGRCEFLGDNDREEAAEELKWLRCSYGLVAVRVPVRVAGTTVMWIICGHVFVEKPGRLEPPVAEQLAASTGGDEKASAWYENVEMVSKNRLISAAELLRVTAYSLSRIFVTAAREKEIQEYRLRWLSEQNEKIALEADLHKMRIALIEAQINPHFLFNTLNLIAESAVVNGNNDAAEIVYALADLLRFSLKRVGHPIYLKEELEYIQNYLHIQQHRFPDSFTWTIEVPEDFLDLRVPAMILQPLVENFFVHGLILNGDQKGFLRLRACTEGESLKIAIEDNGRGLCPGKLEQIRRALEAGCYDLPAGTGIRGVFWRLRHYFGAQATIKLESQMGRGTKVAIFLPYRSR